MADTLDATIEELATLALPWTLYTAYQADGSRGYCAVVDSMPSGAVGHPTPLIALLEAFKRVYLPPVGQVAVDPREVPR